MRLNTGFSGFADDDLGDETDKIIVALTGNSHFPTTVPTLAQLIAARDALRSAVAQPEGPGRGAAILAARTTLIDLLTSLGEWLPVQPGVTLAALATTGYKLPKKPVRATAPPPAPGNLRLSHTTTPGTVRGVCDPAADAKSYEWEWTLDPVNGPWTGGGSFTNTRNVPMPGLPRGKDVWIRVRALGTRGFGPWGDPATIMPT